jgi:hypothetical protein
LLLHLLKRAGGWNRCTRAAGQCTRSQ